MGFGDAFTLLGNINITGNASKDIASINAQLDQADAKMGETEAATGKVNMGAVAMGGAMVAAGTLILGSLQKCVDSATTYGASVLTMQRLTGDNAQTSSAAAAIMDRYGVSGTKLGLIIKTLDTQIIATTGAVDKQKTALGSMGIATTDSTGKNRDAISVLGDVAEWYSKATDKTAATAEMTKVLGRGYIALLPLLAGGKAGLEQLTAAFAANGLILTQQEIDATAQAAGAQKDLSDATQGLAVQIGFVLVPLETFATKLVTGVVQALDKTSPAMKTLIAIGGALTGVMLILGGAMTILGAIAPMVATGMGIVSAGFYASGIGATVAAFQVGGLTLAMETLNTAMAASPVVWVAAAAAIGLATGALINQIPWVQHGQQVWGEWLSDIESLPQYQATADQALSSTTAAFLKLHPVFDATTGALTAYGQAMQDARVKTQLGIAPTQSMTQAQKDAIAAANGETTATNNLTTALDGEVVAKDSLSGKARSLTDLQLAEKTATLDLKDAQSAYTDVLKKHSASSEEAQRAEIALVQAQEKNNDASVALQTAMQSNGVAVQDFGTTVDTQTGYITDFTKELTGVPQNTTVDISTVVHDGPLTTLLAKLGKVANNHWTAAIGTSSKPPMAAGDIISPNGAGTDVTVAENGYPETLINWSPANKDRNVGLLAKTMQGLGMNIGGATTHNYNLTVNTSANAEPIITDFAMMRALAVRGT